METLREIYTRYKIMPSLQMHQLRVAAVGKTVCEHFKDGIDTHAVVAACLLHDMGNILKFDLSAFPDFLEPEGLAYWQGVKDEYEVKYGRDQHAATLAIARELGVSEKILRCIDCVAFSKAEDTLTNGSWEEKVCEYADSRVSPHGVLTLDERLREARKRYLARKGSAGQDIAIVPPDRFEELVAAEHEIERRLFARTDITPVDITDASVARIIEELRAYEFMN